MHELSGPRIFDLTTTGRVTGRPHTIEIWFAADGDTVYLMSGGGYSADWVQNLVANPEVEVAVDAHSWPGRGRVIEGKTEQTRARHLLYEKFQPGHGSDLTGWRERSLPIAIDLG